MKKIGVDLDGVIADIVGSTINFLNNTHEYEVKHKLSREDFTSYHMHDWLDGWSSVKSIKLFEDSRVYENSKVIPYADVGTAFLKNMGFIVEIVTARPFSLLYVTTNWLKKRNITYDRLVFSPSDMKQNVAKDENLNYFIEDRLDTALSLRDVCEKVIILDALYNKSDDNSLFRASNWVDIMSFMFDLSIDESNHGK